VGSVGDGGRATAMAAALLRTSSDSVRLGVGATASTSWRWLRRGGGDSGVGDDDGAGDGTGSVISLPPELALVTGHLRLRLLIENGEGQGRRRLLYTRTFSPGW
jgi:hypothetical protein